MFHVKHSAEHQATATRQPRPNPAGFSFAELQPQNKARVRVSPLLCLVESSRARRRLGPPFGFACRGDRPEEHAAGLGLIKEGHFSAKTLRPLSAPNGQTSLSEGASPEPPRRSHWHKPPLSAAISAPIPWPCLHSRAKSASVSLAGPIPAEPGDRLGPRSSSPASHHQILARTDLPSWTR